MNTIEYWFMRANSINLHVALPGPQDGKPTILFHGFPMPVLAGKSKYLQALIVGNKIVLTYSSYHYINARLRLPKIWPSNIT
jgi:pimeloyl-ACP methyl ester carboxylesterase